MKRPEHSFDLGRDGFHENEIPGLLLQREASQEIVLQLAGFLDEALAGFSERFHRSIDPLEVVGGEGILQ